MTEKATPLEKIRRNDSSWGQVLGAPGQPIEQRFRGDADFLIDSIDDRVIRFWKWEAFNRGAATVVAACVAVPFLSLALSIVFGRGFAEPSGALVGMHPTDVLLFSGLVTFCAALILVTLLFLTGGTPKPNPTYICRTNRKVYGCSGLTGLGGWVELDFDRITAVSVIERRYHQAGRTTTYSLWLCEVDPKTDRITKRVVAMQPSRVYEVPQQTWDFIRSYMQLPPDQVPPVLPWRRGTRWADRVYSANQRLFGMLLDAQSFQMEGPFSRAFAVLLGGFMYPWEITGWFLDRFLRERRPPPGLRDVLAQAPQQPNPYRLKGNDPAEEAKIQAVLKADGWVHASGIALSVIFYGGLLWAFIHAGGV